MIRKSLTVFFILIANIILLAHAVIPHHSHQNEVCIGDSHLQEFICVDEEYAEYVYDCSEYGMVCQAGACIEPEPEGPAEPARISVAPT